MFFQRIIWMCMCTLYRRFLEGNTRNCNGGFLGEESRTEVWNKDELTFYYISYCTILIILKQRCAHFIIFLICNFKKSGIINQQWWVLPIDFWYNFYIFRHTQSPKPLKTLSRNLISLNCVEYAGGSPLPSDFIVWFCQHNPGYLWWGAE